MKINKRISKVCAMALSASMIMSAMTGITVDAASFNYGEALKDGVTFYDANKCGKDAGENNAFSWRDACHVNDGKDVGVDLSGGYHDCGDHVKFGITQGYAASVLGWSYYSYKDSFKQAGADTKMYETLKHFCDYFMKCHPNMFTFYYQLGDGNQDHAYWGAPEAQGDRQTMFKVDNSSAGSDVCGEAAAALALMYLNTDDSAYGAKCLTNAKSLYALGKSKLGLSQGQSFYTSSSYEDDLAWAAVWLYKATGEASYLQDAKNYLNTSKGIHQDEWTMCWDNMWTPAEIMMYEITNDSAYKNAVKHNIDYWIKDVPTTSGGLKYLTQWGCLRYSSAQSMVAIEYYGLTKDESAKSFATKQINYILGDNPSNYSFIVGYGNKYPKHPHHRAANGYTYADSGNLKEAKHVLLGALVGGPSTMGDNYQDNAQDYTASEVGIDYNAGFVGAVAGLIADGAISVQPSVKPSPSVAPSVKPSPSVAPSVKPTPSVKPSPSVAPSVKPSPSVAPSVKPSQGTVVAGDVVPDVKVNTTFGSSINQSYTISSKKGNVDLSKLKIRYNYTKSGNKAQTFTCDNAGLQLNVAPYYVNMTPDVKATFGNGYVDITFDTTQTIAANAGSMNLGCRMYQSDWSSYEGFVDGSVEVYYNGTLVG